MSQKSNPLNASLSRWACAGLLSCALLSSMAAPSFAQTVAPSPTAAVTAADANQVGSGEAFAGAIDLSWDGTHYAASTTEAFVSAPTVVPGDAGSRTLTIRNDGPAAGTLRVSLIGVKAVESDAADTHHNPNHADPDGSGAPTGDPYVGAGDQGDFYDDLRLTWGLSGAEGKLLTVGTSETLSNLAANEATNGGTRLYSVPLERGQTVNLQLGFNFPADATSGNKANVADRLALFKVLLEIDGDLGDKADLGLKKSADFTDRDGDTKVDSGEPITYTFTMTNTSKTATISELKISDSLLDAAGVAIHCPKTELRPSETITCVSEGYEITKADADRGAITNVATATGLHADMTTSVSAPSAVTLAVGEYHGIGGGAPGPGTSGAAGGGSSSTFTGGIDSGLPGDQRAALLGVGVGAGLLLVSASAWARSRRRHPADEA